MDYEIENLKNSLKSRLSENRYSHCLRVADTGQKMANIFGYDKTKAYVAGLMHDIAKELSYDEILSICERGGFNLGQKDIDDPHSLHGQAGAILVKEEFGINDNEILLAIANHAGRPGMTMLEKIIFVSDIDDLFLRQGYPQNILEIAEKKKNIDDVLYTVALQSLKYCMGKETFFSERIRDAFDYILINRQKKQKTNAQEMDTIDEDALFKSLVQHNTVHRLKLNSVRNIRDLGGYETKSGVLTKKHLLIRSENLSAMTKEDALALKDYGISCIIDLRMPSETESAPDNIFSLFRYENCPLSLPSEETADYRNRLFERRIQNFSEEEDAWYISQYLTAVDMVGMYTNILSSPESLKQIRKILSIMTEENSGGILFHCTSGKDRTGIIAAIALSILGVDSSDVRLDYYTSGLYSLKTAETLVNTLESFGYEDKLKKEARRFVGISLETPDLIYQWMTSQYGSTDSYIETVLQIPEEIQKKFVEKYLD